LPCPLLPSSAEIFQVGSRKRNPMTINLAVHLIALSREIGEGGIERPLGQKTAEATPKEPT